MTIAQELSESNFIDEDEDAPDDAAYAELRGWQLLQKEDDPTEDDDLIAVEELPAAYLAQDEQAERPEEAERRRPMKPLNLDRVTARARQTGEEDLHPKLKSLEELEASLSPTEFKDLKRQAAQRWDKAEDDDWQEYPWVPWGDELVPIHVGYHLSKVKTAWRKSAEAIVETGKTLIAMQDALEHGEWLKVFKYDQPPFDERTAQKLMRIARHPSISNPTNSSDLPSAVDTLYHLSRLPQGAVDSLLKSGTVNPRTTSTEVQNLYVFKLPELLDKLSDVDTRHDPDEVMDHAAYELWRQHGSSTADLFKSLAEFLTKLHAAYGRCEEAHCAEWQKRADAEFEEGERAERTKKLARARRPPKWRAPR